MRHWVSEWGQCVYFNIIRWRLAPPGHPGVTIIRYVDGFYCVERYLVFYLGVWMIVELSLISLEVRVPHSVKRSPSQNKLIFPGPKSQSKADNNLYVSLSYLGSKSPYLAHIGRVERGEHATPRTWTQSRRIYPRDESSTEKPFYVSQTRGNYKTNRKRKKKLDR